jgi:hypothetical protein
MDKLYPIIRRKRRPLIQENPEMLKAETLKPGARVEPAASAPILADGHLDKPKAENGENVSSIELQ